MARAEIGDRQPAARAKYCPRCHDYYADDLTRCPADGEPLIDELALPAPLEQAEAEELRPGTKVGEYTLAEVIGRGGMGVVYRAENRVIGSTVAIKTLSREHRLTPVLIERFLAEARVANQVDHPNVVKIFGFGTLPNGDYYYVMEFLRGVSLRRWLAQHGPRSLAWTIGVLRPVAGVLDAMRSKGIIHRDLKPGNIMLVRPDLADEGGMQVKVLDFGIAKLLTPSEDQLQLTRPGQVLGTLAYMAHEQCLGLTLDHRADIHALGVIAYELLTGKRPFAGETIADILVAQREGAKPPSELRPSLAPGCDEAIARALAIEPADRFGSARELTAALTAASGAAVQQSEAPTILLDRPERASPDEHRAAEREPETTFRLARGRWRWITFAVAVAVLGAVGFALGGGLFSKDADRLQPAARRSSLAPAASSPAAAASSPAAGSGRDGGVGQAARSQGAGQGGGDARSGADPRPSATARPTSADGDVPAAVERDGGSSARPRDARGSHHRLRRGVQIRHRHRAPRRRRRKSVHRRRRSKRSGDRERRGKRRDSDEKYRRYLPEKF